MSFMANTGWTYTGSAGYAATYGETVEITAGSATLIVTDPDSNIYKITGKGIGTGYGLSWLPASVTYSGESYKSAGTDIYGITTSTISIDDLSCLMVIYSASALGLTYGGAGNIAVFVNPDVFQKAQIAASVLVPIAGPLGILGALTASCKALCCFAGAEVCLPQLGADVTGTAYWMSTAELQDPPPPEE